MRIRVGQHPARSTSLPGQPYGAMYLGDGDQANDIHSNSWRGYCISCGAVSLNELPLTPAWDEARDHYRRVHQRP